MITAAITQAISAGQVPYRPPSNQSPRGDPKRHRSSRDRGVRQYLHEQEGYDEADCNVPPDNGFEDYQQFDDQSNGDDFGSNQ